MAPSRSMPVRPVHFVVAAVFLGMLVLAFWLADRPPLQIEEEKVWNQALREGERVGIDPGFIYAICWAESSLNANADSGYARGMMQMSRVAWQTVSDLPWSHAFRWRANMRASADYLAHLRDRLEASGQFSYPKLAAAYRYGIGALESANYQLGNLPAPSNDLYREIFAGNSRPVPPPGTLAASE